MLDLNFCLHMSQEAIKYKQLSNINIRDHVFTILLPLDSYEDKNLNQALICEIKEFESETNNLKIITDKNIKDFVISEYQKENKEDNVPRNSSLSKKDLFRSEIILGYVMHNYCEVLKIEKAEVDSEISKIEEEIYDSSYCYKSEYYNRKYDEKIEEKTKEHITKKAQNEIISDYKNLSQNKIKMFFAICRLILGIIFCCIPLFVLVYLIYIQHYFFLLISPTILFFYYFYFIKNVFFKSLKIRKTKELIEIYEKNIQERSNCTSKHIFIKCFKTTPFKAVNFEGYKEKMKESFSFDSYMADEETSLVVLKDTIPEFKKYWDELYEKSIEYENEIKKLQKSIEEEQNKINIFIKYLRIVPVRHFKDLVVLEKFIYLISTQDINNYEELVDKHKKNPITLENIHLLDDIVEKVNNYKNDILNKYEKILLEKNQTEEEKYYCILCRTLMEYEPLDLNEEYVPYTENYLIDKFISDIIHGNKKIDVSNSSLIEELIITERKDKNGELALRYGNFLLSTDKAKAINMFKRSDHDGNEYATLMLANAYLTNFDYFLLEFLYEWTEKKHAYYYSIKAIYCMSLIQKGVKDDKRSDVEKAMELMETDFKIEKVEESVRQTLSKVLVIAKEHFQRKVQQEKLNQLKNEIMTELNEILYSRSNEPTQDNQNEEVNDTDEKVETSFEGTIYNSSYTNNGYYRDGTIYDYNYHITGYYRDGTIYDYNYHITGYY